MRIILIYSCGAFIDTIKSSYPFKYKYKNNGFRKRQTVYYMMLVIFSSNKKLKRAKNLYLSGL